MERIRGLQGLGLSLRQIAQLIEAPDTQVRQALHELLVGIDRDIAALTAVADQARDHLSTPMSILPQQATVGVRHLHVCHLVVDHPRDLAAACPAPPTTLLTWLLGRPDGSFTAAFEVGHGGERITLPARTVIRAVVPPSGVVQAGHELFDWLHRHHMTIAGPTVETHLVDADGSRTTVLEVPVVPDAGGRPVGRPLSPEPTGQAGPCLSPSR